MVVPFIIGGLAVGAISERYGINPFGRVKGLVTPNNSTVDQQAAQAMREQLVSKEGFKNVAYYDKLGILTVGIGHKVTASDNIKLGQYIDNARIEQLYTKDSATALNAAIAQAKDLDVYNLDMVLALVQVNFQLGIYWQQKFPNTWSLLKSGKKSAAINNLKISKWYRQTPDRVQNFAQAIDRNFA